MILTNLYLAGILLLAIIISEALIYLLNKIDRGNEWFVLKMRFAEAFGGAAIVVFLIQFFLDNA